MRAIPPAIVAFLAFAAPAAADLPPLPEPVSNNAVAVAEHGGREVIVSLLGLGPGRTWRDLRAGGWMHLLGNPGWSRLPPLPDRQGRLAASAATVAGHIYVFGGYTVAADGSEKSTPHVYRLDLAGPRYVRLADMPVPVDDSVALVHLNRYVYLVSGWHDTANVSLVQVYDTVTNRWLQATPWPGTPVFGHAAAISDGRMLVCDGVEVLRDPGLGKYAASDQCWLGMVDAQDPLRITWIRVPPHPGLPRYRMAALAHGNRFLLIGGSANPYNYNGIGYDGRPSEPEGAALMFDLDLWQWQVASGPAVMDLRALAVTSRGVFVVGGMYAGQRISRSVLPLELRARP